MTIIRTRFAPSPTGYLHVGSVRTALYCWLHAKKCDGKFILRIEDTDRERSTKEAVDVILTGLKWLGLDWDEGPFYQTERFDRYREIMQQLLDEGKAYRCYCPKERLDALRDEQLKLKEKPRYDGHCRELKDLPDPNKPYVVRFKNPLEGEITLNDIIRGTIIFKNAELDDLIIFRTDGTPTYNFAVVVDDLDMQVSIVIRGEDHITNTPRQINIFKALNANIPQFAHIPMILGGDGKRLSKRHGAVSVLQYRDDGFLPEALLNYLVRLGWAYGDQEIFTKDELIKLFDINNVHKAAAIFDINKLLWLNQHYIKTLAPAYVAEHLASQFAKLGIDTASGPSIKDIVIAQQERAKTLKEMAEKSLFFYKDFDNIAPEFLAKHFKPNIKEPFALVLERFTKLENWEKEAIHQVIVDVAEKFSLGLGKLAQPIRIAITGGTISPPIDITLQLLGKEKALQRVKRALEIGFP